MKLKSNHCRKLPMYNLHGDYVETNTYFEKLNSNLDAELLGKPNHSCPVKPPSVHV